LAHAVPSADERYSLEDPIMSSLTANDRQSRPSPPPNARWTGVIVTAGSHGGLAALRTLLASLPEDFSRPIVVVQHRTTQQPFFLPKLLGRVTPLTVKVAVDDAPLEPGTVYVVPPGRHASLERGGSLRLFDGRRIKFVLSSANPLFESVAREVGPGVIAVVLSGAGSDATDGVQAVKRAGGTVIVQDRASAEVFDMPQAAIATGAVDYVLPIDEIGPLVATLSRNQCDH
jgi:two-component system chemotaxis response regulator CheB